MSIGAIGALDSLGTGAMMGTSFYGQTGAITQKHMVMPFGTANSSPWSADMIQAPGLVPCTKVDISDAARAALASDGPQAGTSMSELAQALIVALMLQLLQDN